MAKPKVFGNLDTATRSKKSGERCPVGIPEPASMDDPVRNATVTQVGQGARLAPVGVVIDRAGHVHHHVFGEGQAVPTSDALSLWPGREGDRWA